MAAPPRASKETPPCNNNLEITIHDVNEADKNNSAETDQIDYSQRAQWLRAAVLGANDGLVSVASLMMGVGAVKKDIKAMLLAGFAGLVAGAGSMAVGEFVSVCTQRDIELAQAKREQKRTMDERPQEKSETEASLPNPAQAAVASALAFSVGAVVPLLSAGFVGDHKVRLAVMAAVVSVALLVFGGVSARIGRTPIVKSSARVFIGGWMAMVITFGFTKLIGTNVNV